MASNSGFNEKMDALDLIINALKAHEKRLDNLLNQLPERTEKETFSAVKEIPLIVCNRWHDFKSKCSESKAVTFEIKNNFFHLYSIVNDKVFRYSESLPNERIKIIENHSYFSIDKNSLNKINFLQFLIDGKLKCGIKILIESSRKKVGNEFIFEVTYNFNIEAVKEFLSRELDISKDHINEGRITYQTSV